MEPKISQIPSQRLLLSQGMRMYMQVLQMGGLELQEWLEEELRQNPLLEWDMAKSSKSIPFEVECKESLFDCLMAQAREVFSKEDLKFAEAIFRNLDKNGFFTMDQKAFATSLGVKVEKIKEMLKKIQTFEPKGIGAENLAECLMVQIDGKQDTLLYEIILNHFEKLYLGKWGFLKKHYKLSDESFQKEVLNKLKTLNFSPSGSFRADATFYPYPDLTIKKEENRFVVEISDDLPKFHVNDRIESSLKDDKKIIRGYLAKGKWMMRILNRRRQLLLKIGLFIVQRQREFLDGKKGLANLSIKEIAEELEMHPSTIARAFREKYADTPFGIKPLNFFLSGNQQKEALRILKGLLEKEDQKRPYTDQELVLKMKEAGHTLARRTVAKYRKKIRTASSMIRKNRIDHSFPR